MHGRARPGDDAAIVEDGHHHGLVGIVGLTVAGIVDDEDVAFLDAHRGIARPILVDELDRILHEVAEDDDAAGTRQREVSARRVDSRDAIAPFRAGGGAHVLQHLETFVDASENALADDLETNGIVRLLDALIFIGRARLQPVIFHDLGIGREIEARFLQEVLDGGRRCTADVHVVTHCVSSRVLFVVGASVRHCEEPSCGDEAIQEPQERKLSPLDCFAPLAMTGLGLSNVRYPCSSA